MSFVWTVGVTTNFEKIMEGPTPSCPTGPFWHVLVSKLHIFDARIAFQSTGKATFNNSHMNLQ